MKLETLHLRTLLCCLFLAAGCSSKPPLSSPRALTQPAAPTSPAAAPASQRPSSPIQQVRAPDPPAPSRQGTPRPVGPYHASYVSGDYAGYSSLERFIERMVQRHGFPREYLEGLFSQVERKQWTLDYLERTSAPAGPPRPGSWSRYRSKFLTETHVSGGSAFWREYAPELERAHSRYGVPPEYIVGIIGVETSYGGYVGSHRVIDALTTLAFDYPRRSSYFESELETFLLMTREERIDPAYPVGSYAGAMGLGQFMPSSFTRWAVDFDGDGRRDLWDPVDAIGSVANYLADHGWRRGEAVVTRAVASETRASSLESGFDTRYSLPFLAANGIRPSVADHDAGPVRLLRLRAYRGDQYWLGQDNFYVITRYNPSTYYGMAVHELSQAVKARHRNELLASRR